MYALDKTLFLLTEDVFYGRPQRFRFTNLQVNNVRSDTLHVTIKPAKLDCVDENHKIFCFVSFYDIL